MINTISIVYRIFAFTQVEPIAGSVGIPAFGLYTYSQGLVGHASDKSGLWPEWPENGISGWIADQLWHIDSIREPAIAAGRQMNNDPSGNTAAYYKLIMLDAGLDSWTLGASGYIQEYFGVKPTYNTLEQKIWDLSHTANDAVNFLIPSKSGPTLGMALISKKLLPKQLSRLKEIEEVSRGARQNKHAREAAKILGYREVKGSTHGESIFTNGKDYISLDNTVHNGGFWKKASSIKALRSKETRDGTYDIFLEWIGK